MMQRHQYIGNLCRDPESLTSKSGTPYVKFDMAVNTPNSKGRRTDYVTVVSFTERVMKFVRDYLRKGSSVWVEGTILTASAWKKKDGTLTASLNLTADDVQGFGHAGVVGGGDGMGDAAEPDNGDESWNPKKYEEDDELPWG